MVRLTGSWPQIARISQMRKKMKGLILLGIVAIFVAAGSGRRDGSIAAIVGSFQILLQPQIAQISQMRKRGREMRRENLLEGVAGWRQGRACK